MTAGKKLWLWLALWLALPAAAFGRPDPRPQFRTVDTYVLGPKQFAPGTRAALRILTKGVIDLKTSRPIPLARVSLSLTGLATGQEMLLFRGHSDLAGVTEAHFRLPNWQDGSYDLKISCATPFGTDTIKQRIQLQRLGKFLLTTDKTIYQTGEAIFIRSLLLDRHNLKPFGNTPVVLTVKDPAGNEVFLQQQNTTAFGLTNTVFQLSDEIRRGHYAIEASVLPANRTQAAVRWITVRRGQKSPAPRSTQNCAEAHQQRPVPASPPFHLRCDSAEFPNGGPLFGSLRGAKGTDPVFLDLMINGQTVLCRSLEISSGRADFKIPLPADLFGSLELHAYRIAHSGQLIASRHTVYVHPPQELSITIARDRAVYQVGDKARFRFRVTDQAGHPQVASLGLHIANQAAFSGRQFRPGRQKRHFTSATTGKLQLWSHPAARRRQAIAHLPPILTKAIRSWGAQKPLGGKTPAGHWVYRQNLIQRLLEAGLLAPKALRHPLGGQFTIKAAQNLWPALQPQSLLAGLELDRLRALRAAMRQALVKQEARVFALPAKAFDREMESILRRLSKQERQLGFSLSGQRYRLEQLKKFPGFSRADFQAQIMDQGLKRMDTALATALGYLPAPTDIHAKTLELNTLEIHSPAAESLPVSPCPAGLPSTLPQTLHFLPDLITNEKGEARVSLSMSQANENWQMLVSANSPEGGLGSIRHRIRVLSVEN